MDGEVHARFQQAMAKPGLSKAKKKQVRELYEELMRDGVLAPPPGATEEADDCPCPACTAARAARGGRNDASEAEAGAEGFDGTPFGATPFEGRPTGSMPADHAAAKKPDRDKGLRALYHKLARQYHPDRAEDDAERAAHGDVMRQVNDAYHSGDTQRLLELSRELGIDVEGLVGGTGLLQELVQQYENLKAELRAMRASFLGTLVIDTRRAARDRSDPPLEMLLAYEVAKRDELRRVRDFVGGFVEGKVSLTELMEGPPRDDAEELEALRPLGPGHLGRPRRLRRPRPEDVALLQEVLRGDPRGAAFESILRAVGEVVRSTGPVRPRKARASAKGKKNGPPKRR
ncbi:MAG: J domain-containing protein [Sandaracinaceae bacterium]|nr:J domain-containing protein [Sandaracinaceae bacterium]